MFYPLADSGIISAQAQGSPNPQASASQDQDPKSNQHADQNPQVQELKCKKPHNGATKPQDQEPGAPLQTTQAPQTQLVPPPPALQPPPNKLKHNANTSTHSPRSSPPPVPYDPSLRMDVLSTRALLDMVHAWKRYIKQVERGKRVTNVHLTRVLEELVVRRVLNSDGMYAVDLRRLDLEFRRA